MWSKVLPDGLGSDSSRWGYTRNDWTHLAHPVRPLPPLCTGRGRSISRLSCKHTQWITPIVGPLMLIELGTAFWLAQTPPAALPVWQIWTGLGLVMVIWASTALLQIPLHNSLGRGLDVEAIQKLVTGNWVRTIAWSVRSVLVLWWVQLLVQESSF